VWNAEKGRRLFLTDDRMTLLSSVDPSRWTSNYYFWTAMYDPS
jgi:hypothetical protein